MSPSVVPLEPWHKVRWEERKRWREERGERGPNTFSHNRGHHASVIAQNWSGTLKRQEGSEEDRRRTIATELEKTNPGQEIGETPKPNKAVTRGPGRATIYGCLRVATETHHKQGNLRLCGSSSRSGGRPSCCSRVCLLGRQSQRKETGPLLSPTRPLAPESPAAEPRPCPEQKKWESSLNQ